MKTIKKNNYEARINKIVNGYGEDVYRVKVLCMTGTHVEGDCWFLKEYAKKSTAILIANKMLKKFA